MSKRMHKCLQSLWREKSEKLGEDIVAHFLAKQGIIAVASGESKLSFDLARDNSKRQRQVIAISCDFLGSYGIFPYHCAVDACGV